MKNSIQNYIMKRLFVTFIPIAFIIIYLLFVMKWQNDKYGSIVKNISIATEFNFKFDFCARDHNLALFKDKHE